MGATCGVRRLPQGWNDTLAQLFHGAVENLIIVTPYFTGAGTQLVAKSISSTFAAQGKITFLTDLSPSNVCAGAAQPSALLSLQKESPALQVIHLPNLHAKVYVADWNIAIVTSGNLTSGGLYRNHEYGLLIESEDLVTQVRTDIDELSTLGARLTHDKIRIYAQVAEQLVSKQERKLRSARRDLAREFESAFRQAEDELIGCQLAGGSVTAVFERTVIYLLRKHAFLSTREMHPMIKAIHPNLCDDSIDRVIDGQHFGKKWKHFVRIAQSHLKSRGEIENVDGKWRIK